MSKYGERKLNWFEAIVNKMGGEERAEQFLRGELVLMKPSTRWREENGIIYFEVTSNGRTGPLWIKYLERHGFHVGDFAREVLLSPKFKPTNGVTYSVAVLKGELYEEGECFIKTARDDAKKRGLGNLPMEAACLIRDAFSDENLAKMGLLTIIVLHEPFKDSYGHLHLLAPQRCGSGRGLKAESGDLKEPRGCEDGFAFADSGASS